MYEFNSFNSDNLYINSQNLSNSEEKTFKLNSKIHVFYLKQSYHFIKRKIISNLLSTFNVISLSLKYWG